MAKGRKSRIWSFFNDLEGDKVVWMIVLLLILISAVSIFSSTSMMTSEGTSRLDIVRGQLEVIVLGLVFIVGCYCIKDIKIYRTLAKFGFVLSAALLLVVDLHIQLSSSFGAGQINGAWRVIKIGGFQLHVYEVVKVAMVMYLAWAVDTFNRKGFKLFIKLSEIEHLHWLKEPLVQKIIYIYLPILIVMVGILPGSGSSCLFIGIVMFVTIIVGGLKMRELILPALICIALFGGTILLNKATGGKFMGSVVQRVDTWGSRLEGWKGHVEKFKEAKYKSPDYFDELDKIRQPYSARIAIHEGGLIGKGPGQSTQRYVVPVMYEDYMFSFILEEYGLLGGIFVIILYLSLLARGSIIVRNCKDNFGKIVVAGLVIMISGQAFMHMFINAGIGPLTGQTLPLISHGKTSFLVFCIAFGVILSISKMAGKQMEKERKALEESEPIVLDKHEEIQASMNDLDMFESLGVKSEEKEMDI